jgi:hypothetical protein
MSGRAARMGSSVHPITTQPVMDAQSTPNTPESSRPAADLSSERGKLRNTEPAGMPQPPANRAPGDASGLASSFQLGNARSAHEFTQSD